VSHQSGTVIIEAGLLNMFDPTEPEYAEIREHFTVQELEKIDELRALPASHDFSLSEKLFVSYVINKAIFTAD